METIKIHSQIRLYLDSSLPEYGTKLINDALKPKNLMHVAVLCKATLPTPIVGDDCNAQLSIMFNYR